MRQINTGNILPFYATNDRKSSDIYSPTIEHVIGANFRLLPFQIVVPAADYVFQILNVSGAIVRTIQSTNIQTTLFQNTVNAAYTYAGNIDFSAYLSNCGIYQIAVKVQGASNYTYFSDFIFIKELWNYSLFFSNATDISNVFYQNGYTQCLRFDGFEDVPLTDIVTKLDITLSGKELITSSRQVEKRVIVGHGFLDSQLSSLQRIEQHGSITLFEGSEFSGLSIERITVKQSPTSDDLHDCTFTIDVDISSQTGCGENTFTIL